MLKYTLCVDIYTPSAISNNTVLHLSIYAAVVENPKCNT